VLRIPLGEAGEGCALRHIPHRDPAQIKKVT